MRFTVVKEDRRGGVMSFYPQAFMGTVLFGSLFVRSMTGKAGASETAILGGVACILSAILFGIKLPFLRQMVRPIYVKKGIRPE